MKRIIVIPNDESTAGMFKCSSAVSRNSCWPGVDILHSETLPPGAQEFILRPGEALMVPYLAWHAVENLEASVAYGFRINRNEFITDWDSMDEGEKESALELGYTKESWNAQVGFSFKNIEWEDLPAKFRKKFESEGVTKEMWDSYEEEDGEDSDDEDSDDEESEDE